jgi:importin-7
MLSYFTFFEEAPLSPRLWTLWPQIHSCLTEFAIESWPAILVPLDNLISRDTATFLGGAAGNPSAFLQSAYDMVAHSLNNPHTHESDLLSAPRLLCVVLQNCRGQVDAWVDPYLALVVTRLAKTERRSLKDELLVVVANALHYNPLLALQALQRLGAVGLVFSQWFAMIFARRRGGKSPKPDSFRLLSHKRAIALGLIAILQVQDANLLPAEIVAGLPQVLAGILRVLDDFKAQEEERAKEQEEDEDDDEEGGDEDDDDEEEEEADEGFAVVEADDTTHRKLRAAARSYLGGGDDDDDDDNDDEDGWTDEEDDGESPLDQVDPFAALERALAEAAPARAATLASSGGAPLAAALECASARRRRAASKK